MNEVYMFMCGTTFMAVPEWRLRNEPIVALCIVALWPLVAVNLAACSFNEWFHSDDIRRGEVRECATK